MLTKPQKLTVFTDDNKEIHGTFHLYDRWHIVVEITFPFEGITMISNHVPYFMKNIVLERYYKDNDTTTQAYIKAKELLFTIYNEIRFFLDHREELKVIFCHTKDNMKKKFPSALNDNDFQKEKENLRKELKNKTIDSVAYQKQLSLLKKRKKEFDTRVSFASIDGFVDEVKKRYNIFLSIESATKYLQKYA